MNNPQYCKVRQTTLSLDSAPKGKSPSKKIEWIPRATDTTRKDIADWRRARAMAENTDEPFNYRLQNIYSNIMEDGLLTSQVGNRTAKVFNVDFKLQINGEDNDEQTQLLKNHVPWRPIHNAILDTIYYEYSLGQFQWVTDVDGNSRLTFETLPRTNVVPQNGRFYQDIQDPTKYINYRDAKEYGIWWLEFGSAKERGLLNKAVKHVLMKSFSQACWAELCEIYGIPPRYMKTNTQDSAMLARADKMMRDMGSAAYFIIDETEEFSFAQGVSTNGDVYDKLMNVCNNENSMLISGAIIGQDTKNGSRSKDEAAQEVLWELVIQDLVLVEDNYNSIVIPALKKLGILKGEVKLKFEIPEDLQELWKRVQSTVNNFDYDIDWLNDKFGLKITGVKNQQMPNQLGFGEGFFV